MEHRIEKRIELNAPVSRVWRALTDHREFGEWFRVNLDGPFVAGKAAQGRITYPGYEHVKFEAVVQRMEPERFFSYTWHPYAVDPRVDYSTEKPTLVEFTLEPTAGGTLLTVTESGFDKIPANRRAEAFRRNQDGWAIQIENIQEFVADNAPDEEGKDDIATKKGVIMDNPELTQVPIAKTGMLIRRPVGEVFEAFINPNITTKFWFTKSSGRLEPGKQVQWDWQMYDISIPVTAKAVEPNKRIVIEWAGYGGLTTVEWIFEPQHDGTTFVRITEAGFTGDGDQLVKQVSDSTGGFCWVLAGLKALLEHNIRLNLVPDRFPKGIEEH